jgi:Methyltransferase domain
MTLQIYASIRRRLRKKRMQLFSSLVSADNRILDIGGLRQTWVGESFRRVVILNLQPPRDGAVGVPFILADGKQSPFDNRAFDVVFSNSVIEHVGDWHQQKRLAAEIRRLSRYYFVQTPNRWFPIEPHCLAPLVQFVPSPIRSWIAAWLTPAGWLASSHGEFQQMMDSVRLLTESEMHELFPEAIIVREKFCGLTKSFIAVHACGSAKIEF